MTNFDYFRKVEMIDASKVDLEPKSCLGNDLVIAEQIDVKRVFPPYFHVSMLVCIIMKKGLLRGRCNLMDIEAAAPCMSILLPDQILEYTDSTGDPEGMVVLMSSRFLEMLQIKVDYELMRAIQSQLVIPLNEEALSAMLQFCYMMKGLLKYPDHPFLMETALNLTRAFFFGAGYFFHQCTEKVVQSRGTQLVEQFLKLVQGHFRVERQLGYYSRMMCLSTKHLSATVKAVTGKTAGDWIEDYVMLEAKALLSNTDMTVSQVSDYLHFPDASTFGKYFKRNTGLSPKEFRKQNGGNLFASHR